MLWEKCKTGKSLNIQAHTHTHAQWDWVNGKNGNEIIFVVFGLPNSYCSIYLEQHFESFSVDDNWMLINLCMPYTLFIINVCRKIKKER